MNHLCNQKGTERGTGGLADMWEKVNECEGMHVCVCMPVVVCLRTQ